MRSSTSECQLAADKPQNTLARWQPAPRSTVVLGACMGGRVPSNAHFLMGTGSLALAGQPANWSQHGPVKPRWQLHLAIGSSLHAVFDHHGVCVRGLGCLVRSHCRCLGTTTYPCIASMRKRVVYGTGFSMGSTCNPWPASGTRAAVTMSHITLLRPSPRCAHPCIPDCGWHAPFFCTAAAEGWVP